MPLFSIVNSDQVRMYVEVPQSAANQIEVSMDVTVSVADTHDASLKGNVSRTADAMDIESRTPRVQVLVPNPRHTLEPGTYVEAKVIVGRKTPPLKMPTSALAMRPSGPQAAVVDSGGRVQFRDIHIAEDLGHKVDVDRGLSDGERVALDISSGVTDGEQIATQTESEKPAKPVVADGRTASKEPACTSNNGQPTAEVTK